MGKKKKNQEEGIRIPRTAGLTMLCRNLTTTQTKKETKRLKEQIKTLILNRFITDGFTLNGTTVDLPFLATYLNISLKEVFSTITKQLKQIQTMMGGAEDTYRALLGLALNFSLEASHVSRQQAHMLIREQGDKYVPYLTSAANTAIKNQQDAVKPLIELMRTLQPASGPAVNIQNNNGTMITEQGNILGTNEAVRLIDQGRGGLDLLSSPEAKDGLFTKYLEGAQDVEVVATKQQGFKVDAAGIVKSKPKRKSIPHEDRPDSDGDIVS